VTRPGSYATRPARRATRLSAVVLTSKGDPSRLRRVWSAPKCSRPPREADGSPRGADTQSAGRAARLEVGTALDSGRVAHPEMILARDGLAYPHCRGGIGGLSAALVLRRAGLPKS
jgi:hypothetical protein